MGDDAYFFSSHFSVTLTVSSLVNLEAALKYNLQIVFSHHLNPSVCLLTKHFPLREKRMMAPSHFISKRKKQKEI